MWKFGLEHREANTEDADLSKKMLISGNYGMNTQIVVVKKSTHSISRKQLLMTSGGDMIQHSSVLGYNGLNSSHWCVLCSLKRTKR